MRVRAAAGCPCLPGAGIGTVVNGMRCLPPVCLVFVSATTEVTVFLFDGQQVPTEAAPVDVGITSTDRALRLDVDGNVVALLTGSSGVIEAEIAPDGTLIGTTAVTVPGECSGPSGPVYVQDSAGFAALFTCVSSDNFVVARSSQP